MVTSAAKAAVGTVYASAVAGGLTAFGTYTFATVGLSAGDACTVERVTWLAASLKAAAAGSAVGTVEAQAIALVDCALTVVAIATFSAIAVLAASTNARGAVAGGVV